MRDCKNVEFDFLIILNKDMLPFTCRNKNHHRGGIFHCSIYIIHLSEDFHKTLRFAILKLSAKFYRFLIYTHSHMSKQTDVFVFRTQHPHSEAFLSISVWSHEKNDFSLLFGLVEEYAPPLN